MAQFAATTAPCFVVTVDTEEDFDWNAPFRRDGYRLDSVPALAECQRYFAAASVIPAYLVDWPIAHDPHAIAILAPAAAAGKASIGVQLHPWVNPPFDEMISVENSFAGNLPETLERAKLTQLHTAISKNFGVNPVIYRAGRYGTGPNTISILEDLGFRCDTSVRSGFSYRGQGGPDYSNMPLSPWWTGHNGQLLEIPLTTVFCGAMRGAGQGIYHRFAKGSSLTTSALARLGLIERIALTPEGIPADKACIGIDEALARGVPVLNFSFHSPSLMPGNTPYVRNEAQLVQFYRWWDVVLNHLAKCGVAARSMESVIDAAY